MRKQADAESSTLTKGERTREAILLAGRAVFGRDGYGRARMSDIAQEAGLSQGAIYRYFRNKDDVFRAVLGDLDRQLFNASTTGGHFRERPAEAIYEANLGYLSLFWESRGVMGAFHEAAASHRSYRTLWEDMRRQFRERFLHVLQVSFGVTVDRELELLTLAAQCSVEEFAHSNFSSLVHPAIEPPVSVEEAARVTSAIWFAVIRDIVSREPRASADLVSTTRQV
ncbi:MAG: helix-turn-helix domain-containing protein [Dehalococcoidia bacterium]